MLGPAIADRVFADERRGGRLQGGKQAARSGGGTPGVRLRSAAARAVGASSDRQGRARACRAYGDSRHPGLGEARQGAQSPQEAFAQGRVGSGSGHAAV